MQALRHHHRVLEFTSYVTDSHHTVHYLGAGHLLLRSTFLRRACKFGELFRPHVDVLLVPAQEGATRGSAATPGTARAPVLFVPARQVPHSC